MTLYEAIGKTLFLGDKPSEELKHKRYIKNKSSEETEFVVAELVSNSTTPQYTLTESTLRTNDLFVELLSNQLRSKM